MIIPIGIDCGLVELLKKNNLRKLAFPFDWIISSNGISECINDNFLNFIPEEKSFVNKYDMFFMHDFSEHKYLYDKTKYLRRIQRLQNLLENGNEEIIFIRKGHACHHHEEEYYTIKNDINDAVKLDIILSNKYKNLNYKIILV